MSWVFLYDGNKEEAAPALEPFDSLSPLSIGEATVPYRTINDEVGGALNGSLCEPNKTHTLGTANLLDFNVTAERAIYDLYNRKVNEHPELGNTRILHECYAMQGVQALPAEDSAYPYREENILT